jgi:hypothetical protein
MNIAPLAGLGDVTQSKRDAVYLIASPGAAVEKRRGERSEISERESVPQRLRAKLQDVGRRMGIASRTPCGFRLLEYIDSAPHSIPSPEEIGCEPRRLRGE